MQTQQVNPAMVDVADAKPVKCVVCDGVVFLPGHTLGNISRLSPRNKIGQDVIMRVEISICRNCGHLYGQPKPDDIPAPHAGR